jgi:transcription elongation GreA/GreB family factor
MQAGLMDKVALLQAIVRELEKERDMLANAANLARDEATNEESRAEDRFDMRSQTAAYLAAGQARMAGETEEAIVAYRNLVPKAFGKEDLISTGALVTLANGSRRSRYFLGPQRGGLELEHEGEPIIVVTAASPLGRQLVGKRVGDVVLLPGRPKPVQHRVDLVR